jgi:hypothetical protein
MYKHIIEAHLKDPSYDVMAGGWYPLNFQTVFSSRERFSKIFDIK